VSDLVLGPILRYMGTERTIGDPSSDERRLETVFERSLA
jgi:hypothetical protein